MSTDLEQAGNLEGRDNAAAVSSAETMLLDSNSNRNNAGGVQGRTNALFRRAAGTVVGALRFDTTVVSRTAEQGGGQWAVQQPAAGERGLPRDSEVDQVLVRVQVADLRFFGLHWILFLAHFELCRSVLCVLSYGWMVFRGLLVVFASTLAACSLGLDC